MSGGRQGKTPPGFLGIALPVVISLLSLAVARWITGIDDVAPALLGALVGVGISYIVAAICVELSNGRVNWRRRRRRRLRG